MTIPHVSSAGPILRLAMALLLLAGCGQGRITTGQTTSSDTTRPVYNPPREEPPPAGQIMPGRWTGRYWDAEGMQADLELRISVTDSLFTGIATVTPIDIHGGQGFPVPFRGYVSGDTVTFLLALSGRDSLQPGAFSGRLRNVGSYAFQSIYGMVEDAPGNAMSGGVWILWRFAE